MAAPVVFFDIAGSDSGALAAFYAGVFGWEIKPDGQFSVEVTMPLEGMVRADPPEKRIYLGVDDVSATLDRIRELGGSVDAPRFEVPGVVVLGLFKDPAGNGMGLVEMENGRAKVP